jgi:DNA/RNA endonuclease YhcR with UshA esterase domain
VPETGKICGVGVITEYRGSPEIVLRDAKSWYVPK